MLRVMLQNGIVSEEQGEEDGGDEELIEGHAEDGGGEEVVRHNMTVEEAIPKAGKGTGDAKAPGRQPQSPMPVMHPKTPSFYQMLC